MILIIAITAMVIKVMIIQVIVLPIAVMIQMLRQLLTHPTNKTALMLKKLLIILNKVVVEVAATMVAEVVVEVAVVADLQILKPPLAK